MNYFLDDLEYLKVELERINEYSKHCYKEGITPKTVWYSIEQAIKDIEKIQKKNKDKEMLEEYIYEELYGYEDCYECKTKPDQIKGVGLKVSTIKGKMYYECTNCGFNQAG